MAKEEKRVRLIMNTIYAHPEHGSCAPGGEITLPESSANELIKGNYAKLAPAKKAAKPVVEEDDGEDEAETADGEGAPETATAQPQRGGSRR